MLIKSWQTFLLYASILPSLFVLFHTAWLSVELRGGRTLDDEARTHADPSSSTAGHAAPPLRSFVDPVWSDWGSEDSQFETLVPPSEIDYSIKNRLPWEQKGHSLQKKKPAAGASGSATDDRCGDILLFMPQMFARNGHGSQLNNYLLAAMIATFTGKAMVVLEAPQEHSRYPNGSQFGCPIESFKNPEEFLNFKGNDHSELEMRRDFPKGLERLIRHPSWISRDCAIPVCDYYDYSTWEAIRRDQSEYFLSGKPPWEITCAEKHGDVRVTVLGGEEVRRFFDGQYREKMVQRSSGRARERAYDWAVRLGATDYMARVFSRMTKESDIWDYVSALIARSGLVTFQPWIVRDVRAFIEGSRLPLDQPHDAIHVRRGDKLATDAREEVVHYWHSQGYERQVDFPLNYIPFTHYLRLWETDCRKYVWDGVSEKSTVRTIYLATDDPETIRNEISKLPIGQGGTTIVGGCERVKFVFSPSAHHGSFHLSEGGVTKVDCVERYERNIHSIADLMILTKSNTFVGEFNSNWGRVVRIFRTQLNDMYVMPEGSSGWKELLGLSAGEERTPPAAARGAERQRPVLIHDIRIAFAEDKAVPPPGW